jgi:hypothetical protein
MSDIEFMLATVCVMQLIIMICTSRSYRSYLKKDKAAHDRMMRNLRRVL